MDNVVKDQEWRKVEEGKAKNTPGNDHHHCH